MDCYLEHVCKEEDIEEFTSNSLAVDVEPVRDASSIFGARV